MTINDHILSALRDEERVMLATVIKTSGSTPAAALSKMMVKQHGITSLGTVGGGCMEGEVLLLANRLLPSGQAAIQTFHLNEDDMEHGLICGGTLDVLVEPLTRADLPLLNLLHDRNERGADVVLIRWIARDGAILYRGIIGPGMVWEDLDPVPERLRLEVPQLAELIVKVHRKQETERISVGENELILEPVAGSPSLLLFGGGHVGKYICRFASMVGFRVTVVDDREKFANAERFPEAAATLAGDFENLLPQITIGSSTYVVIATRGHHHDETILSHVVHTPAAYIGMIGSRRKIMTTYKHLSERGVAIALLRRVYAPMGLEIGALTAEEIALSVVAEITAIRRNAASFQHNKADETRQLLHLLERTPSIA